MSQTVGCETQMNCDDSWVPSCLFFSPWAAHIWLYIFLSPDLTHQYLYFLKLAPPWNIHLRILFLNASQFLGILLSLLFFPQVCVLESLSLTSESEFRSLLNSLLGLDIALYSSISHKCFKCHSILLHLQGRFLLRVTLTWGHFLSSWSSALISYHAFKKPGFLSVTLIFYGWRSLWSQIWGNKTRCTILWTE